VALDVEGSVVPNARMAGVFPRMRKRTASSFHMSEKTRRTDEIRRWSAGPRPRIVESHRVLRISAMNAIANRMSPGITTMIRMDHSHVMALFHRYKADTPVGRKRSLIANACLALETHAQLEEEIFYPALRTKIEGDQVLDKSKPEHDEMRRLIGELRARTGNGESIDQTALDDKFLELMRAVMHHVADEETRLLPAAERLMGDQLSRLGMEMTRRRMQLLRPHAGEVARTTVRSFPMAAATGALLTAGAVTLGAVLLSRRGNGGSRRGFARSPASRL
jgi:hypothetical protein